MFDLLIDLDNTVYSENEKIFSQVDAKMKKYISKLLGLNLEDSYSLQKKYFKKYGTTLRGLMLNHNIEPESFLNYVHDIDLTSIEKNNDLEKELASYSGKKIIFTNGTKKHAKNVLSKLGIDNHIDHIFDIVSADYIPKPNISSYRKVIKNYKINTSNCIMIDDIPANLKTAKDAGISTMLIKNNLEFEVSYNYVDNMAIDLKQGLIKIKGIVNEN